MQVQFHPVDSLQRLFQTTNIQFLPQHFFPSLSQQQVARVILFEHFEEQTAGSLDLSRAFRRAGVAGKHQSGYAGDFPKAA
ncbi:hypothetical protein D3C87_1389060 [compost metagenome]